ncbi:MAG: AAA family ATPase [Fibrobacteria bacterium]|nr:AAA family ATPase [Fibrobacteria bacterium]
MKNTIIGRVQEKSCLETRLNSERPEFLAIYGRRRVGKTFLIHEFFKDKGILFEFTGSKQSSNEIFLARFCTEISYKFYKGENNIQADTWEDCFKKLKTAIDTTMKEKPKEKIIIFIDELPWIAQNSPEFMGSLDFYWNRYFSKSKYHQLFLIVCGSAATWMLDNIINNTGGLYNRITQKIKLLPFTLKESCEYLKARKIFFDQKELTELYMAIGGVPYYLSLVEQGKSVPQTINELCFKPQGYLVDEFELVYKSLFKKYQNHLKIVRALATVKKGMTRNELLKKAGIPNGGSASQFLGELESSGFILKTPSWGKKKKETIFRLYDEYSLFYLNWIEPVADKLTKHAKENYWLQTYGSQAWYAWAGCAFEGVCIKHVDTIIHALGISGILNYTAGWRYTPPKNSDERGVQIDLLIDRGDKAINICELKFSDKEYKISKDYKVALQYKKSCFRTKTNIKHPTFLTMITCFGAKEDYNYIGTVDNQITLEALFAI